MHHAATAVSKFGRRKAMGVHYTPALLARFIALRLMRLVREPEDKPLRILDPACGDGVLLESILKCVQDAGIRQSEVCGVETDARALHTTQERLAPFKAARLQLLEGDFLELCGAEKSLWEPPSGDGVLDQPFDIVIANPPYVRTQVLGAGRSRQLASRYGLTGRLDLYQAFLVAVTQVIRPQGVIGIITSNRFLTTLGGASTRDFLARHYEIEEVIDLGDTKLFEASVLPAVFFGRRREPSARRSSGRRASFVKVYSAHDHVDSATEILPATDVVSLLEDASTGRYRLPEGIFVLTRGEFAADQAPRQVWSLITQGEAEWMNRIRERSCGIIGDVASVRVGIKTTADEVFIKLDWESLAVEARPEPALLHPLLRHEDAGKWSLPSGLQPRARVLYPHEISGGERQAVDLGSYPRARTYLETHRMRLESRRYVLEAGRRWYEIWVPQAPDAWQMPKVVFPDISAEPRFYLDLEGRLVDGDCYWMTLRRGIDPDILYLLLGIANSRLMSRFHDLAFNNKLYSGRRRYITQYVAKYPYPDPGLPASQKLVSLAKTLVRARAENALSDEISPIENEVDTLIEEAFGVPFCEAAP
jgi:adenine-specific DNA-methyltransferase